MIYVIQLVKCKECGKLFNSQDGKYNTCFQCSMEVKGFVKCKICEKHWHDPKWVTCYKCYGDNTDDLF